MLRRDLDLINYLKSLDTQVLFSKNETESKNYVKSIEKKIKEFKKKGGDLGTLDDEGKSALMHANILGNYIAAHLLLEADEEKNSVNLDARDNNGYSALDYAAQFHDPADNAVASLSFPAKSNRERYEIQEKLHGIRSKGDIKIMHTAEPTYRHRYILRRMQENAPIPVLQNDNEQVTQFLLSAAGGDNWKLLKDLLSEIHYPRPHGMRSLFTALIDTLTRTIEAKNTYETLFKRLHEAKQIEGDIALQRAKLKLKNNLYTLDLLSEKWKNCSYDEVRPYDPRLDAVQTMLDNQIKVYGSDANDVTRENPMALIIACMKTIYGFRNPVIAEALYKKGIECQNNDVANFLMEQLGNDHYEAFDYDNKLAKLIDGLRSFNDETIRRTLHFIHALRGGFNLCDERVMRAVLDLHDFASLKVAINFGSVKSNLINYLHFASDNETYEKEANELIRLGRQMKITVNDNQITSETQDLLRNTIVSISEQGRLHTVKSCLYFMPELFTNPQLQLTLTSTDKNKNVREFLDLIKTISLIPRQSLETSTFLKEKMALVHTSDLSVIPELFASANGQGAQDPLLTFVIEQEIKQRSLEDKPDEPLPPPPEYSTGTSPAISLSNSTAAPITRRFSIFKPNVAGYENSNISEEETELVNLYMDMIRKGMQGLDRLAQKKPALAENIELFKQNLQQSNLERKNK